ncbi:MAG TPA: guanylate cyclase, partial [Coleofasciculaceae cyanobacterium]
MLKRLAKIPKKAQLRLILVVPFVVQIFFAVGLTGYLSLRNGQQAVNQVKSELLHEISDRIQLHLRTYLEIPHQVNQFNANAIDLGLVNLANLPSLDRFLGRQLDQFPTLTSINISTPNQGYIDVIRREDGSTTVSITDQTTGRHQSWATDNQGNLSHVVRINPNHPDRAHIRYQDALQAGKPIW